MRDVGGTAPPSGLPAISPARGEISCRVGLCQSPTLQGGAPPAKLPISPLAGEMAGRPEGGVKDRGASRYCVSTVADGRW
ncbi:MAG: hypothetical protein EOQ52_30075, partial [Mesorhizobium sp.]